MLSFAESYDPLWVAYDKEKTIKVNSIPLYSVINGFYINKTETYELTIEYTPQRYFYMSEIFILITNAKISEHAQKHDSIENNSSVFLTSAQSSQY